jgi:hypothetical protein
MRMALGNGLTTRALMVNGHTLLRTTHCGHNALVAEAQKMKGISILVDRLYSGYEPGNRRAMRRSSTMAL